MNLTEKAVALIESYENRIKQLKAKYFRWWCQDCNRLTKISQAERDYGVPECACEVSRVSLIPYPYLP